MQASDDVVIHLPQGESNVLLVYPNGQQVEIQHRLEGPTLDICFDADIEPLECTNWVGGDMKPAKGVRTSPNTRLVNQLCIGIPPDWVDA